jgi:hypothetical protein
MNRRLFFALTVSALTAAATIEAAGAAEAWQLVPQILQRIQPPTVS